MVAITKRQAKAIAAAVAATAGTAAAVSFWYYYRLACQAPALIYKDGPLSRLVLTQVKVLQQEYRPTPWALNAHIQTFLGVLRCFYVKAQYNRQLLMTPDGGTIALDWFRGSDTDASLPPSAPVFMVFHGLTGGSSEGYCKGMCLAGAQKGWRAVVFNYRGCAGLPLTSPHPYTATFTGDAHQAIEAVHERFPAAPLYAAGFSLGAVILTKYLAEADQGHFPGQGSGITAAAMVSSPLCLRSSAAALSRPWTLPWVYNLGLAVRLAQYFKQHVGQLGDVVGANAVAEAWTLAQFDEAVICKLFGYASPAEYYEDGSSVRHIPALRTPALFLVALDDPFLGALPVPEVTANPHVLLAVAARGGHVAFLQGMWPFGRAWSDGVVVDFLEACHRSRAKL